MFERDRLTPVFDLRVSWQSTERIWLILLSEAVIQIGWEMIEKKREGNNIG